MTTRKVNDGFTLDLASIFFVCEIFKASLVPDSMALIANPSDIGLPENFNALAFEQAMLDPSRIENNLYIARIIMTLLSPFPNPFKKTKKLGQLTWPYLLKKLIDLNLDDLNEENPMKVKELFIPDIHDLEVPHPFFSLHVRLRIKILYFLSVWVLETVNLRTAINASARNGKTSNNHIKLKPIGTDKKNNEIWHIPFTTRIYSSNQEKTWKVLTDTFEELVLYESKLKVKGGESLIKKKLATTIQHLNEKREKERRYQEEEAKKAVKREQKRLEYEAFQLLPRRGNRRARGDFKKFFSIASDEISDKGEIEDINAPEVAGTLEIDDLLELEPAKEQDLKAPSQDLIDEQLANESSSFSAPLENVNENEIDNNMDIDPLTMAKDIHSGVTAAQI